MKRYWLFSGLIGILITLFLLLFKLVGWFTPAWLWCFTPLLLPFIGAVVLFVAYWMWAKFVMKGSM